MRCKNIVIVEDDADIRDSLALALEFEGYHVTLASNGKEGLELLPKGPSPCLILLDLMMPIMNGWEFLEAKRKDDILAVIPVVIVSAFSEEIEFSRGVQEAPHKQASQLKKDERVQSFIKKPVDLELLLKTVRQYCG